MRLALALLALAGLGCSAKAAAPAAAAAAAPAPPAASASAEAPAPASDRVAAALRDRGRVSDERVPLPKAEATLAFLVGKVGDADDAIRAAWVVPDSADQPPRPVLPFPVAVRLVGSYSDGARARLLLESVAFGDQPGGLVGGLSVQAAEATSEPLLGLDALADLSRETPIDRQPPEGLLGDDERSALVERMNRAGRTPEGAAALVGREGLEVSEVWQGIFRRRRERVPADRARDWPGLGGLQSLLALAGSTTACAPSVCEIPGDTEFSGRLVLAAEPLRLRGLLRPAPAPAAEAREPRAVLPGGARSELERMLRERFDGVYRLLAHAPLGEGGGMVGLVAPTTSGPGPWLAVSERGAGGLFELTGLSMALASGDPAPRVRFVDADGDGRTDLLVRAGQGPATFTALYTTPSLLRPIQDASFMTSLPPDPGASLALLLADTPEAASDALLKLPRRAVTPAQACALLRKAGTLAGFRRVSTPRAAFLTFQEPLLPTFRARRKERSALHHDDVKPLAGPCAELTCDRRRPYCFHRELPGSEHYWFAWEGDQLKLAGFAFYTGS